MTSESRAAVALFSGGLDSILAAKLLQEQGIDVTCLHFFSPFFGHPERIGDWRRAYGLRILAVDVSREFVDMLRARPIHGFGSALNPCVDCKILMLRRARVLAEEAGACCIASGEVIGQRPMSQRRDTLNVISRDAGVRGLLLRPLCAQHMDPTEAELRGLVDRSRLPGIYGRGRKEQLALAERMGLKEIPTPAGGCRLTETESARSYWPVLTRLPDPGREDFELAIMGRQLWHGLEPGHPAPLWLIVGRNQADNDALMRLGEFHNQNLILKTRDFPGPIAVLRWMGRPFSLQEKESAAALAASYSPKAVRRHAQDGAPTAVRLHPGHLDAPGECLEVAPSREPALSFAESAWPAVREELRAEARKRQGRG